MFCEMTFYCSEEQYKYPCEMFIELLQCRAVQAFDELTFYCGDEHRSVL